MDNEELARKQELLKQAKSSLHKLQLQEMNYGVNPPIDILNGIERFKYQITAIEQEIEELLNESLDYTDELLNDANELEIIQSGYSVSQTKIQNRTLKSKPNAFISQIILVFISIITIIIISFTNENPITETVAISAVCLFLLSIAIFIGLAISRIAVNQTNKNDLARSDDKVSMIVSLAAIIVCWLIANQSPYDDNRTMVIAGFTCFIVFVYFLVRVQISKIG